jgi:hypothetical protein
MLRAIGGGKRGLIFFPLAFCRTESHGAVATYEISLLPTLESVSDHAECGVYAGVGADMRLSAGNSGYEPIAGHSTELAGTA